MSNKITIESLMGFYFDTLQKCGMHLLEMRDEDIEFNIFEEFDIGATSFLHRSALERLREGGLINDLIAQKSEDLRSKYLQLHETEQWNIECVKKSKDWMEILKLSDEIKAML